MRVPWDKRGSVRYDQMPNTSPETVKGLSDDDLLRLVADHRPNTLPHLADQFEIKRRENATARMAVAISFMSLGVAALALLSSWLGWSRPC